MATAEKVLILFDAHNAFPVLQPGHQQEYIPYNIIAPHEAQAMKNHGQTLQRLAERGGLCWSEIFAVLANKTWMELGWASLSSSQEKELEKKTKEAVLNYISKRGAHCGC